MHNSQIQINDSEYLDLFLNAAAIEQQSSSDLERQMIKRHKGVGGVN